MDSYPKVCNLCEDIKEKYCEYDTEEEVIEKATQIINLARDRKRSRVSNALLNVQSQLSRCELKIMLTRDDAQLFSTLLEEKIKKLEEEGKQ